MVKELTLTHNAAETIRVRFGDKNNTIAIIHYKLNRSKPEVTILSSREALELAHFIEENLIR